LEITVTGRHLEVSDGVRSHIDRGTERLLKHFEGIRKVAFTLSEEGGGTVKAEMVVHAVRGVNLAAEAVDATAHAAVDAVVDRMDRQVRKLKERLKDRRG